MNTELGNTILIGGGRRPRVYIVILNWNRYDHTKKCIESLRDSLYQNLKVIIVDNASVDESGGRLQAEFPQCQFIFNGSNLGFARGCNVGIRAALQDEECAYVLLINNDATLARGGLEKAIEMAEASSEIGLVSGKILKSPQSKIIWYAGGYVSRWRGQAMGRGFGEVDHGQYDIPCHVGFITGALMLIRREVLDSVGLLPEEYFLGVEEWDYSLSVQRAGYKLLYVPDFVAFHEGDGSHWNWDPKYVYNYYRNKLLFQEKFLPKGLFPIWRMLFVLHIKYWARRKRKTFIARFNMDKPVRHNDLDFALREAVKDHGRNILSEEAMECFAKTLESKRKL